MENKSPEYWQNLAASLRIEGRAFIDGEYRDAASGNTFDCVNPSDGSLLAKVPDSGEADLNAAVAAARRAFEKRVWAGGLNPRKRKSILLRWAGLIRTHMDELALMETLDAGKPISDTTSVDVPGAAY